MKRLFSTSASALVLLLAVSTAAQADPLPPPLTWTYNFSPGAPAVTADGNPAAGVTFTNEPENSATGNSDIVATNLRVFSAAPASTPDLLTNSGAYSLTLTLGIPNTGLSGSLTFNGKLGGSFSKESANVTNAFPQPDADAGPGELLFHREPHLVHRPVPATVRPQRAAGQRR